MYDAYSDCVFVILYIYMAEYWISPQQLLVASSVLTVVGYVCSISITGLSGDIPHRIWTCEYPEVSHEYLYLQLTFGCDRDIQAAQLCKCNDVADLTSVIKIRLKKKFDSSHPTFQDHSRSLEVTRIDPPIMTSY